VTGRGSPAAHGTIAVRNEVSFLMAHLRLICFFYCP
jgi:hypothetical protein